MNTITLDIYDNNIHEWVRDVVGVKNVEYSLSMYTITFKNDSDLVAFKLKFPDSYTKVDRSYFYCPYIPKELL